MADRVTKRPKRKPPKPPRPGTNGKPPKPPALAPEVTLPDPGDHGPNTLLIAPRTAGVRVTEDTALTLGAFWACVKVITEDLSVLPWRVFRRRPDGGRDEQPNHDVDWILHVQANEETPAFQFRETILAHALTWGNGYAEIERDLAGRPVWLWQITPDRVKPQRFRGRIIYDVANPREPNTVLEKEEMFHVHGLGFDGLVGYNVIKLAARTIGLGIAMEEAGTNLFANDTTPGGILKHPQRLSEPAKKNLDESWKRRHGGPHNRRVVAILEEGMTWEQTGLDPDDAKLVEQMGLTPAQICRWLRVAPHKIADLIRATFSNIEEQNIDHVGDCLMPWARRLESQADIKLFGRTNRGQLVTKLNFNARLRGNAAARSSFYTTMIDRGIFCINDVLGFEDMNPIGPDGDKRFVQGNMQLLEDAGEQPELPAAPPPAEAPPEEEEEPALSRLESACLPILVEACGRVLKREKDRAEKAKKGEWGAWCDKEIPTQRDYALESLISPVRMLAEIYSSHSDAVSDVGVGLFLDRYVEELRQGPTEHSATEVADRLRQYVKAAAAAKRLE